MDKHTAYFNILDALPRSGCIVCGLGHDVEVKYIRDVLYSQTTSVETRAEWRKARGLCLFHARQLDKIGHALGVSIFYQDITLTLKELLEQPSPQRAANRRGRRRLSGALAPEIACPACTHRDTLETVYIETLLDHLEDPAFVDKLRVADPLCVVHLRSAIEAVPDARRFQTLRDIQIAHWEGLIAELGEFIRKHDHRFQDEAVGREGSAWLRTLDAIAGKLKW